MKNNRRIIIDPEMIDRSEWKKFVSECKDGNVFHTPEYYDILKESADTSPIAIFYIEGEIITGVLLAATVKATRGLFSDFTSRAIVWGGPVVKDRRSDVASTLLKEYCINTGRNLFTQFRNLTDYNEFRNIFLENGFMYEDHMNIMFNLGKGKENLWQDVHPTRRKQINRSIRRGVIAEETVNIDSETVTECYHLLSEVYKRESLPLPGLDYFLNSAKHFSNSNILRIFIARFEGRIIGFRMILAYHGVLYDWYAASSSADSDKYPNDLLPWIIMENGCAEGFTTFDFGGAGKPGVNYGVRDYKLKFGGETVNYGRFTRIHKTVLYGILISAFKIRRKFFGKK
jgi:hypothetical protein